MSRTLSAGLTSHLAAYAQTPARCARIDLVDGTILAITDHDSDIAFDLGDAAGEQTYLADTGIVPSNLALSSGFSADDIEIKGPITDTGLTTRAQVLGGRFDDAEVRFFEVDWSNLAAGAAKLVYGYVVQGIEDGDAFRLIVNSEISKLAQTRGQIINPYCKHDFGVGQCQAVPATLVATVSAVTDARNFDVTYSGTYADDYWNRGTVQFSSGGLNGTRAVRIFDFTSGGAGAGSIALWIALADAPEVGDTLTLRQGCYDVASNASKVREACMAFAQIDNFGGYPDAPGSDQVLRYPQPGN